MFKGWFNSDKKEGKTKEPQSPTNLAPKPLINKNERSYLPEDLLSEENKKYDWTMVYTFYFEQPSQLSTPFNAIT